MAAPSTMATWCWAGSLPTEAISRAPAATSSWRAPRPARRSSTSWGQTFPWPGICCLAGPAEVGVLEDDDAGQRDRGSPGGGARDLLTGVGPGEGTDRVECQIVHPRENKRDARECAHPGRSLGRRHAGVAEREAKGAAGRLEQVAADVRRARPRYKNALRHEWISHARPRAGVTQGDESRHLGYRAGGGHR